MPLCVEPKEKNGLSYLAQLFARSMSLWCQCSKAKLIRFWLKSFDLLCVGDEKVVLIFQIYIWTAPSAEFFPTPPLDNIRVMVIVWRLRGNIIRTLCAGLCDTLFTVSSTLM